MKQLTISRSSSEAEYRALSAATYELQWLLYLLNDLHVTTVKLPVLYCDNQSALHIGTNPMFHEITKHIEIICHLVRDKLQAGIIKFLLVSSKDQLADIFTNPLLPQPFSTLLSNLGMLNSYHSPACGGILENEEKDTKHSAGNLNVKGRVLFTETRIINASLGRLSAKGVGQALVEPKTLIPLSSYKGIPGDHPH
ncbi:Pol polyprotein/retrotransposon, putative [Medicago truncatula]|uniref:Pol polyprotein/retrotransposon, putative n=1 Tax=Medicago truncatula TaxID=3880 RepID=A0A072U9I0_MEDTR|nr:Pol polyprotein/retrotransposon, putative [Medicago truncatula]